MPEGAVDYDEDYGLPEDQSEDGEVKIDEEDDE